MVQKCKCYERLLFIYNSPNDKNKIDTPVRVKLWLTWTLKPAQYFVFHFQLVGACKCRSVSIWILVQRNSCFRYEKETVNGNKCWKHLSFSNKQFSVVRCLVWLTFFHFWGTTLYFVAFVMEQKDEFPLAVPTKDCVCFRSSGSNTLIFLKFSLNELIATDTLFL